MTTATIVLGVLLITVMVATWPRKQVSHFDVGWLLDAYGRPVPASVRLEMERAEDLREAKDILMKWVGDTVNDSHRKGNHNNATASAFAGYRVLAAYHARRK